MKQEKIPVITPLLDQRHACLKYEVRKFGSKPMKKRKTPGWFYASSYGPDGESSPRASGAGSGVSAPPAYRPSHMRQEMERLERIQDWLRQSYKSPVGLVEYSHINNNTESVADKQYQTSRSATILDNSKRSGTFEQSSANSHSKYDHSNDNKLSKSEPILPKLPMFKSLTGDPEVIGTSISSQHRSSNYKPKSSNIFSDYKHSEYQTKSLPSEMTADEYINRRSKTHHGMNNGFSGYQTDQQILRKGVGPIQRPHEDSLGDVLIRQRTRFGDTMMHAKSPSKAYIDQKGRTYKLHSKLKDMLLHS